MTNLLPGTIWAMTRPRLMIAGPADSARLAARAKPMLGEVYSAQVRFSRAARPFDG